MNNISIKDKVHMENEKIKVCNQIKPKLKAYFEKYLDQKICKNDRSLIQNIKNDAEYLEIVKEVNYKVKPVTNGHVSLSLFCHCQYTTLKCLVKLCFSGGSYDDKTYYCIYTEQYVYIGEEKNTILSKLEELKPRGLINYKQQERLINRFKSKSKELKEIKDKIDYSLESYIKYDYIR